MYPSTFANSGRREHRGRRWLRNRAAADSPNSRTGEKKPASSRDAKVFPGWMDDMIRDMESDYMMIGQELCYR